MKTEHEAAEIAQLMEEQLKVVRLKEEKEQLFQTAEADLSAVREQTSLAMKEKELEITKLQEEIKKLLEEVHESILAEKEETLTRLEELKKKYESLIDEIDGLKFTAAEDIDALKCANKEILAEKDAAVSRKHHEICNLKKAHDLDIKEKDAASTIMREQLKKRREAILSLHAASKRQAAEYDVSVSRLRNDIEWLKASDKEEITKFRNECCKLLDEKEAGFSSFQLEMKKALASTDERIAKLQMENDEEVEGLEAALKTQSLFDRQEAELKYLQEAFGAVRKAERKRSRDLVEQKGVVQQLTEQVRQLREELDTKEQTLMTEMEETLTELTAEHEAMFKNKVSKLEEELKRLAQDRDSVSAAGEEMKKLRDTELHNSSLQEDVRSLTEKLATLQDSDERNIAQVKQKISDLEQEVLSLQSEVK